MSTYRSTEVLQLSKEPSMIILSIPYGRDGSKIAVHFKDSTFDATFSCSWYGTTILKALREHFTLVADLMGYEPEYIKQFNEKIMNDPLGVALMTSKCHSYYGMSAIDSEEVIEQLIATSWLETTTRCAVAVITV